MDIFLSILYLFFAGIDFMINLHGCIAVFKKKEEGNLVGAGEDLMVNLGFGSFKESAIYFRGIPRS